MVTVTFTWRHLGDRHGQPPTIYEALRATLGREPSLAELTADVRRILAGASIERRAA